MYPDTDSPPIPVDDDYIAALRDRLPVDIHQRYAQLKSWEIPEDTHPYLLRNNLCPILEKIITDTQWDPKYVGTLFGHTLKHIEGQSSPAPTFTYDRIYDLLMFIKKKNIDKAIAKRLLPVIYNDPELDFDQALKTIHYNKTSKSSILERIPGLKSG